MTQKLFNKVYDNFQKKQTILVFLIIGQAKNLVQMWKTIDKENTPPSKRRGLRAITPPVDNERHISPSEDVS